MSDEKPIFLFQAFSNFFYEMDFLNMTTNSSKTSLTDYKNVLTDLCNSPWSKVSQHLYYNNVTVKLNKECQNYYNENIYILTFFF